MLDQLDQLYRDVILDHFKHSSHAGTLPTAQIKAEGNNPLCGDELWFDIAMEGATLKQVRFHGKGCAISQAAASMLSQQLEGKSVAEAEHLIKTMKALMQGRDPDASVDLGDLAALAGVRKFPVRVKCAALSWNIVEQGLQQHRGE
jgi:nitrogen fixation NifU-like protein